jgi:hypothetical protein
MDQQQARSILMALKKLSALLSTWEAVAENEVTTIQVKKEEV